MVRHLPNYLIDYGIEGILNIDGNIKEALSFGCLISDLPKNFNQAIRDANPKRCTYFTTRKSNMRNGGANRRSRTN